MVGISGSSVKLRLRLASFSLLLLLLLFFYFSSNSWRPSTHPLAGGLLGSGFPAVSVCLRAMVGWFVLFVYLVVYLVVV